MAVSAHVYLLAFPPGEERFGGTSAPDPDTRARLRHLWALHGDHPRSKFDGVSLVERDGHRDVLVTTTDAATGRPTTWRL